MKGHTAEQSVIQDLVALLCEQKKKSEVNASIFTQSENKSCYCLKIAVNSQNTVVSIYAFVSQGLGSYGDIANPVFWKLAIIKN